MSKSSFTLAERIGTKVQGQVRDVLQVIQPEDTDDPIEQMLGVIAPHATLGSAWAGVLEMMHTAELLSDDDFQRLYRDTQRLALDVQRSILLTIEKETDGALSVPGLSTASIDDEVDKLNASFRKGAH